MNWHTPIDLYSERVGLGFWAEPLNAWSNISFIFAALYGLYVIYRLNKFNFTNVLLCISAAGIGVGSFLFHTFANLWSSFADVLPIWIFVILSITTCISRLSKRPRIIVLLINSVVSATIIFSIILSESATQTTPPDNIFNGSLQYIPALVALWFFAASSKKKRLDIYPLILCGAIFFSISLVSRTVDIHLCSVFPLGTHFLWHVLNGLMVGCILLAIIRLPASQHQ
ncbi:MAG: ceramidase [Desulfobacterales bacterium]|nr:ceramidase [Desulfobacterales bacterium]